MASFPTVPRAGLLVLALTSAWAPQAFAQATAPLTTHCTLNAGTQSSTGPDTFACGDNATASGQYTTAIGNGAQATQDHNLAVGALANAQGLYSTAVGAGTGAIATRAAAIGAHAEASGEEATAVGAGSEVAGQFATGLGSDADARADHSVALGAKTLADRENTVSVGNAETGLTRQITNVGRATHANDAVNLAQMNERFAMVDDRFESYDRRLRTMDDRIDGIAAMSTAMSNMTASAAGVDATHRFAAGVGTQNGENAFALGYQRPFAGGRGTLTFGGAVANGDTSIGAGVGFGF